ncbi:MAG: hypothetical protein RRC07_16495 [Anaerolineae bacterium]|nr:hypothetical protein [Anaerolineae bacterium]
MQQLNLEPTYRVVLPPVERLTVILVGVGGTGSSLAPALTRLAYHLRSQGVMLKMLFVDHDVVERRNVLRQNYKLFGIKGTYLHHYGQIQDGGAGTNEYRHRLAQVSPCGRPGIAQSLAQLRGIPWPGE